MPSFPQGAILEHVQRQAMQSVDEQTMQEIKWRGTLILGPREGDSEYKIQDIGID
jgi:hypothetical protein